MGTVVIVAVVAAAILVFLRTEVYTKSVMLIFYIIVACIGVYSLLAGREILRLYTMASPHSMDEASIAIKLRSWAALRQFAASVLSVPAFVSFVQKCYANKSIESISQIAITIIICVALYVLTTGFFAADGELFKLKKYGYVAKDEKGNNEWLKFTVSYFMQDTYGIVLSFFAAVAVSMLLLYMALV